MSSQPKKNTIWSDALLEETLCSGLGQSGTIRDTSHLIKVSDRDVESYEYPSNYDKVTEVVKGNHLSAVVVESGEIVESERVEEMKKRLGAVGFDETKLVEFDETKCRAHIPVTELDAEDMVAREIARYLKEENADLMLRIVKVLGRQKALHVLYATDDILDKGGMQTSDGYRMRSPGGVFIQLVRKDNTILNCQRKEIFIEDAIKKKKHKAMKRLTQPRRVSQARQELLRKRQEESDKIAVVEDGLEGIDETGMIHFCDD